MLTAWAKKAAAIPNATGRLPGVAPSNALCIIPATKANGSQAYIGLTSTDTNNAYTTFISSQLPSSGVAVGSGTTPPTENDYTLENQITGLTGTITQSTGTDVARGAYTDTLLITVTNATGQSVVIREVGTFIRYSNHTTYGSASSSISTFMIDRTVLAEPVTIPDGESRVIEYNFAYGV